LRTSAWSAYPVEYTIELDDARAGRVVDRLRGWGAALFRAVFGGDEARRLAECFLDAAEAGRLLTVSRDHPTVLAQPWELLRDPKGTCSAAAANLGAPTAGLRPRP
jgi:hypothetical protein